jgi:DNA-binding NtrC family response regulator
MIRAYPGLKILFVSGYTDNTGVRRVVQTQEAHFLQKPFTPPSLARKVRDIFDEKKKTGAQL